MTTPPEVERVARVLQAFLDSLRDATGVSWVLECGESEARPYAVLYPQGWRVNRYHVPHARTMDEALLRTFALARTELLGRRLVGPYGGVEPDADDAAFSAFLAERAAGADAPLRRSAR